MLEAYVNNEAEKVCWLKQTAKTLMRSELTQHDRSQVTTLLGGIECDAISVRCSRSYSVCTVNKKNLDAVMFRWPDLRRIQFVLLTKTVRWLIGLRKAVGLVRSCQTLRAYCTVPVLGQLSLSSFQGR